MTNKVQIFNNKEFRDVRTIEENGKVLYCGKDVARALGYANPSKALSSHCKCITKRPTQTSGGVQELSYIYESDVYRLITHSRMPSAKKLESWIFNGVLPKNYRADDYSNNDDLFVETYLPFTDETTKDIFKSILAIVRKQNELIQKLNKEIIDKEDVIIGLVDDITLAEKRQILNRVVRYNHANYQDRWKILYREFENKYHIDLQRRFDSYNETNKPKCKNKLDYIDTVMHKVPELYEIASKLFENDIKALVNEMYETAS